MKKFRTHLAVTALLLTALGTGFAYGQNAPFQVAAGKAADGKKVYTTNCATCHGPSGKGDGPVGKSLNPKPRDLSKGDFKYSKTDKEMLEFIKKGKAPMPGFKHLKAQQLEDVVAYIRSLKK